jgi:6-phosphogluconolactonase
MSAEIVISNDPASLWRAVALRIAKSLARAIEERDWAFVALPGGAMTRRVYDELVELQLQWDRVEFYFTDERCVPIEHPASNFGEAQDSLLQNQRIGAHQLHRIETESNDLELAAARYEEELPEEGFDVMLFELGLDGHIGSLFPGSKAIDERARLAVPVEASQKPKRRIALTPAAIARAGQTIVFASGRERAGVVERALQGPFDPRALPAQLVRDGVWMLDRAAAASLKLDSPSSR